MTRQEILGDLTGVDIDNDYRKIPTEDILYDENFNCRGKPDPQTCQKLSDDIRDNGLDNAITIIPLEGIEGKKWKIMAGHRRFIAMVTWLRESVLPCKINHRIISEEDALIFNLNENMQRESLTMMQEANAIGHLKDKGLGAKAASEKLNLSYGWVQVRFMLLALSDDVKSMADDGMVTTEQIRNFYTMKEDVAQTTSFIKQIKVAKQNGKKHAVVAKIKGQDTKRLRNKGEIIDLQAYIARQIGHGLTTRVLAWCQGGITDAEVLETIKQVCEDKAIDYVPPVEGTLA